MVLGSIYDVSDTSPSQADSFAQSLFVSGSDRVIYVFVLLYGGTRHGQSQLASFKQRNKEEKVVSRSWVGPRHSATALYTQ